MKFQILMAFACSFIFPPVAGQNISRYKYFYKFQLSKPKEICSVIVDTLQNKKATKIIKGIVTDNKLQPLAFFSIILKNNDTVIYTTTDANGVFEIQVKPLAYELTISGANYQSLTQHFIFDKMLSYALKIRLAKQTTFPWYNIHSKRKLGKEDIDKIKKCVDANKEKPVMCGRKNVYYIIREI